MRSTRAPHLCGHTLEVVLPTAQRLVAILDRLLLRLELLMFGRKSQTRVGEFGFLLRAVFDQLVRLRFELSGERSRAVTLLFKLRRIFEQLRPIRFELLLGHCERFALLGQQSILCQRRVIERFRALLDLSPPPGELLLALPETCGR